MKPLFFTLCFMILTHAVSHADSITGMLDTCVVSDAGITVTMGSNSFTSANAFLETTMLYAYRHNQEVTIDYTGSAVNFVSLTSPYDYQSKMVSLFIGAVSAGAFALAMGVRLS